MLNIDMGKLAVGCELKLESDFEVVIQRVTHFAPAGAKYLAVYTADSTCYIVHKGTGRRRFRCGFDIIKITA